ncbi:uncharacterized protein [Amphiura filiformis]|uniref:uncharacterized protein n=1 Tax=Amphiura filiformis TaxID=82378 RepID=UPI003B20B64C
MLEILALNDNNIESLPSGIFTYLHQLQSLYLHGNRLKMIQSNLFNGLTKLVRLNLANNTIESLQTGVFRDLQQMKELYLHGNKLKVIQVDLFSALLNLKNMKLGDNMIESLPSDVFRYLPQLKKLWLYGNKLEEIQIDLFNSSTKLEKLFLHDNFIDSLPSGVFRNLHQLQELYLHDNNCTVIQVELFHGLSKLKKLSLNNNSIESLPSGVFNLSSLSYLSLQFNMFKTLPSALFKDLVSLEELRLDGNRLTEMPIDIFHQFNGMTLEVLTLRSNKIARLFPYQFSNLTALTFLDLKDNHLEQIHSKSLYGLTKLKFINLRKNSLTKITKDSFIGLALQNDSYITLADPAMCCFLEPSNRSQCVPQNKKSPYLTCKQLLPSAAVKCCTWIFGFCALFANIVVFIWGCQQIKSESQGEKYVKQIVFITNLALADLIMGLYLLLIASVDQYYHEYFPSYAKHWRRSMFCKLIGFLSVLSSEASLLLLTLIAVDRVWGFRKNLIRHKLFGQKTQIILSTFTWVIALALSIVTVIFNDDQLYQFSDVCIGLPLARSKIYASNYTNFTISYDFDIPDDHFWLQRFTEIGSKAGNYFSIGIFLGLNFLLCLIIAMCYILLFIYICKSGFALMKTDLKMSIKMGAITLTDLMCWLPIIIVGILAQTGVKELSPEWFPLITTFALPINSVLNPFLYSTVDQVSKHFVHRLRPNCYTEETTL